MLHLFAPDSLRHRLPQPSWRLYRTPRTPCGICYAVAAIAAGCWLVPAARWLMLHL